MKVYSQKFQRLKRWAQQRPATGRVILHFSGYLTWIAAFKFLSLTFITYFVLAAGSQGARFEDVNDAYGSSELPVLAIAAASFVLLQRMFDPLRGKEIARGFFTPKRFERCFLPGFLHGAVLASGVILAFLFSGIYRYLGFFVHFDETPFALGSIVLRIASVGLLAYCEEYIFRGKILGALTETNLTAQATAHNTLAYPQKSSSQGSDPLRQLAAIIATSVLYVGAKMLQFDSSLGLGQGLGQGLGLMNELTLFLVSIYLGIRALFEEDFTHGAGFWAAALIVFHPLMSLPLFGEDISGLVLVKYQPTVAQESLRFFSGGDGGPLSGLALQILMAFDIARNALRYNKAIQLKYEL